MELEVASIIMFLSPDGTLLGNETLFVPDDD